MSADPMTTDDPLTPPFASKIAIAVRDDLEAWQRLNVTAFLISAVTAAHPHLVGADYEDADGQHYLRMLGVPVLVFEGGGETLAAARSRAVQRGIPVAVYTRDLFATGHDAENRAAVRAVPGADLDLVGIGLYGPKNPVDKIIKARGSTDDRRPPTKSAGGPAGLEFVACRATWC